MAVEAEKMRSAFLSILLAMGRVQFRREIGSKARCKVKDDHMGRSDVF